MRGDDVPTTPPTSGSGRPAPAPAPRAPGYFGRPVLKPPVWTWEVPLYFFVGGLAGGAAVIAGVAAVARAPKALVLPALVLAVVGAAISAGLLVLDLGRPTRFLNMLRVFKPTSPMSVGAWILSGFGGAAALALASALFHLGPVLFWLGAGPAAVLGGLLATYTGVLIGVTTVPAWAAHDRTLPVHFGMAGLGCGAAAIALAMGGRLVPPLRTILLAASLAEVVMGLWIVARRHGARDRALYHGHGAWLLHGGGTLTGPATTLLLLVHAPAVLVAIAFLVGALINRYGWVLAGKASAADPEAALEAAR
ncbi:MAG: polysulfide reductase NrfD [Myxococcales bacterium]|nr:polysulfide reductase NrfD [Myxococcales bacterium]MCB9733718.1 polysulfide reductase NrfD [Deltaproteobacteria bacterium]